MSQVLLALETIDLLFSFYSKLLNPLLSDGIILFPYC